MNPQDDEPLVIMDDADLAALPSARDLSSASQSYLAAQGVSSAATWEAFRLDQVGDAPERLLPPSPNRRPCSSGIWLPTFHPRDPATITGLIRLTPAQNLHRFLSAPVGLAGAVDLDERNRVVLADNPLLVLRLHQAGVADVALVEDPSVLAPLHDWLATREVVLLATKAQGLAALRAGLGSIVPAQAKLAPAGRISLAVRELLGADPAAPLPALPITPQLMHELISYAHGRLDAGEAAAMLAAFGAVPDLVRAYRIGFLPANYRSAVSAAARRMLLGHRCGSSLVLPALDAAGQVADLCLVKDTSHIDGLWPEPRGMLAPELVAGQTTITVTDCVAWLFRLFHEGFRDVLFMRGMADAQLNAQRIAAAGVQTVVVRCYRHASEYAAIFQAAGLRVVTTSTDAETVAHAVIPDNASLAYVADASDDQVVVYQAGAVRYVITLRDDGKTTRKIVIRAHGKSCQHDLDLAVLAQRERTAANAAQQVEMSASVISSHLVGLLALVQEREAARDRGSAVAVAPEDQAAADGFLADPQLLQRVADDLTALGWIGEMQTKRLMYLTAVSRFLPQPVWAVYQAGAGAAPWAGVDAVAQLTPPEDRATFHHQTSATDRQPRLLVLDQAETVRPDAALKLRIMRERASVAVLAAAAGQLDPRCRDGFLTVTVDESPKQTELILAEQRKQQGVCRVPAPAAIQARHHAAQRLLERLPVAIPFADRIVFPASRVRHRDEQRWFLSLIAASALLHQRQRRRENQVICASEADFDIVRSLTAGLIGIAGCSIGPVAERLLQAMWASGVKDFTLPALADLFPNWSRWTFRAALQDLTDFGHLTTITERLRGGRSQRRHYALNGSRQSQSQGITLLKVGAQTGKLAETGGDDSASLSLGRTGT